MLDWLTVKAHVHEIVFLGSKGELKSTFMDSGVWQYYNETFPLKFVNGPKIARMVKKICIERRPDVVISWPTGTSQWTHAGARSAGIRKLIVHAGNPPGRTFMYRYVYSYFSFWAGLFLGSKVIACSAYIRNEFLKIPFLSSHQFYWVHNCFDLERFTMFSSPEKKDWVIMVATLEAHKDHETLLKAWKIIESRGFNYILKLAGAGSQRERLVGIAGTLNLNQIEFLGSRPDVPELLGQSRIFVLSTTRQEGFGTVLVEALAAGCVVVASDVPACREVLNGGKYGMLVEPANPEKLAEGIIAAMNKVLTNEDLKERLHYLQQFSPARMVENYLKIVG